MLNLEKQGTEIGKQDIRLVGLDLDGTLLTTDKKLTPHTKDVLEAALRQGIQILPATGRTRQGIPDYLKEIEGMRYILGSNGAFILDLFEDEIIYENGIPLELAIPLLRELKEYGQVISLYIDGVARLASHYYEVIDTYPLSQHAIQVIKMSAQKMEEGMDVVAIAQKINRPIEKIYMAFYDMEIRQQVIERMKEYPQFKVTASLPQNLEINLSSCSKGVALVALGEILGIRPDQIMACGDSTNDADMIQAVGHGVAMKNAISSIKDIARYETKTNDEDGVAYAIETLCRLRDDN